MMKLIQSFRRFCIMLIFATLVLFLLPALARAAESDTYTLELELIFYDKATVAHTEDDYRSCAFLIQDADSLYLTAELDESSGLYHVTGAVTSEADATRFLGGLSTSNPAILRITDLSEGSYTMTHYMATAGYALYRDNIAIEIHSIGTTIDGETVDVTQDGIFSFQFVLTKGFNLPDICGGCKYGLALRFLGTTLIAVAAYLLHSTIRKRKDEKE